MSDYNTKIIREQGGSVLRINSAGSISVQAGGLISGAGGALLTGAIESASVTVTGGGPLFLGNVQILSSASNGNPTMTASPGSLFIRTDGSMSGIYVNISDGVSGSVWKTASGLSVMNT